jgi:serine/threonine/tyrosine protein kinase RAD53
MDDSFNYDMDDNLSDRGSNQFDDSEEYEDHQQTQSTQQASQQPPVETNDTHLWGYLQPCTGGLTRIDFWKIHPRYTIGRNTEHNQVVFPGFKISELDRLSFLYTLAFLTPDRQHTLRHNVGWQR